MLCSDYKGEKKKAEVRRALLPQLSGSNFPGHTIREPEEGFELANNNIQFYAIANLDEKSQSDSRHFVFSRLPITGNRLSDLIKAVSQNFHFKIEVQNSKWHCKLNCLNPYKEYLY